MQKIGTSFPRLPSQRVTPLSSCPSPNLRSLLDTSLSCPFHQTQSDSPLRDLFGPPPTTLFRHGPLLQAATILLWGPEVASKLVSSHLHLPPSNLFSILQTNGLLKKYSSGYVFPVIKILVSSYLLCSRGRLKFLVWPTAPSRPQASAGPGWLPPRPRAALALPRPLPALLGSALPAGGGQASLPAPALCLTVRLRGFTEASTSRSPRLSEEQ